MLQDLSLIELSSRPQQDINGKSSFESSHSAMPPASISPLDLPVASTSNEGSSAAAQDASLILGRSRSIIVIVLLTMVQFLNSVATGFVTVGLPRMSKDLNLSEGLLLW